MAVTKRYILRLCMSLKYVSADVIDRTNGNIVTSASSAEQGLKHSFRHNCTSNVQAAAVVGEVLARRLKVDPLETGLGGGIHVDIQKEIERKGFKIRSKVLAVVNALKDNGVCLIPEENHDDVY